METKYYKHIGAGYIDYLKITDAKRFEISIWDDSDIFLCPSNHLEIKKDWQESTRSEFEIAKLKLINYIETL